MARMFVLLLVGLMATPWLPLDYARAALAVSLSLKEGLLTFLPLMILTYLMASLAHMGRGMMGFIAMVIVGLCTSNFIASIVSFSVLKFGLFDLVSVSSAVSTNHHLIPLWNFSLPRLLSNDQALLLGAVLGLLAGQFGSPLIHRLIHRAREAVNTLLSTVLIPLIPFLILGFLIKMHHEGVLAQMVTSYALVFVALVIFCSVYVIFLYGLGSAFQPALWQRALKNNLSPAVSAFCSMSSAAALPLTIQAAERNTHRPDIARAVIPATVSIHLIGDALCVPVLALLVMKSFGLPCPTFMNFCLFAVYMVMAKFAVAAVPGGGILVILPLLETHLGFQADMSALMLALYMLFDPLITCTNVSGNGAFAMILARFVPHKKHSKDHDHA